MANSSDSATATTALPPAEDDLRAKWQRVVGRRSFLKGVGLAGATAVPGSALFVNDAFARTSMTKGDVAIVRLLAAAELIEQDLWEQYNELGGVNGGNAAYMAALSNLDSDMPQYIADNTDDERSHAAFLNAYLRSKGAQPVNLDEFRTLPSTKATGARQVGRLTNLTSLNVDTSRSWVPFRIHRARRVEPLQHHGPEGVQLGGPAHHHFDRRGGSQPFLALAR